MIGFVRSNGYLSKLPCSAAVLGEGGETAVVGHGVDAVEVSVSMPVEYEDVMASSTEGLPFKKSL